jgi:hypothetical protein
MSPELHRQRLNYYGSLKPGNLVHCKISSGGGYMDEPALILESYQKSYNHVSDEASCKIYYQYTVLIGEKKLFVHESRIRPINGWNSI